MLSANVRGKAIPVIVELDLRIMRLSVKARFLIAHLLLPVIKMAGNFLVLLNKILVSVKNQGCG